MATNGHISFRCLPVEQPIGVFYVGALDSEDLVAISWADVRQIAPSEVKFFPPIADETERPPSLEAASSQDRIIEPIDEEMIRFEDQSFEQFLGIQRDLSPGRVGEIQDYVNNVDATFPTGVLLAVSSNQAHYDDASSTMTIVRHSKAAKIIDGQHRIAGLKNYHGEGFQVNVAVFVDMDIQDQAMVFATINLKQTKVNKSLAYDLYEFTTSRSPQRSCHDIVRFLNYKSGSPLQGKVKMLGVGREATESITQATFVDRLLRYISRNPMADRDLIKRRKSLERAFGAELDRRIFRNMFIDDEDTKVTSILWNYFLAVQERWPQAWSQVQQGNILNRSTGFGALMRFLRVAYLSLRQSHRTMVVDEFVSIFRQINLDDLSFSPDTYLPGSSGEKLLFDKLVLGSRLRI